MVMALVVGWCWIILVSDFNLALIYFRWIRYDSELGRISKKNNIQMNNKLSSELKFLVSLRSLLPLKEIVFWSLQWWISGANNIQYLFISPFRIDPLSNLP